MSEFVREIKESEKIFPSQLSFLDIELTERCNNNCVHCWINLSADDKAAQAGEMTTDEVKDLLVQAERLGCLRVRFTGGEPLLRTDFEELYIFARKLGMKVLIFTNACLITPRLVDTFHRISPRMPIEITVYGMRKETYEAVTRVRGSYEFFRRGVNLLLERKVPFIVKSAVLPENICDIDEFEEWAKTIPWMTRRPGYSLYLDLRTRRDDTEKNNRINRLRLTPQDCLKIIERDWARYEREMTNFAVKFMRSSGEELFHCGACRGKSACIDAYGRAQPCMAIRKKELTVDVAKMPGRSSLKSAIKGFECLSELYAANPDYLARCARCFLKGFCEQCPAKSYSEHGTLDTPVEYLCNVAHAQARRLGWLGSEEHGWEITDERERIKKIEREKEGLKKSDEKAMAKA